MKIQIKTLQETYALVLKIDVNTVHDKLSFAVKRWRKRYEEATQKSFDEANELNDTIRTMKASTDDKNNLIIGERGQYSYTPEKFVELNKELKSNQKKVDDKFIDFDPYTVDIENEEFSRLKSIFDEFDLEILSENNVFIEVKSKGESVKKDKSKT